MEKISNLTTYEIAFMRALVRSEYGEDGDGTWEWSVCPNEVPKTSRPGVIGSLVKKGIIRSEEYEKDDNVIYVQDREVQAHFVQERDEA